MTFLNEGVSDRALRTSGGMALLAAGWLLAFNTLGILLFAVGAVLFATGVSGWCPAYTLFHISTVPSRPPAEKHS